MELREFLARKGLTQEDFSGRLGVSQPTVSNLVTGEDCVSLALAIRVELETSGEVPARSLTISGETDASLDDLWALVRIGATFK